MKEYLFHIYSWYKTNIYPVSYTEFLRDLFTMPNKPYDILILRGKVWLRYGKCEYTLMNYKYMLSLKLYDKFKSLDILIDSVIHESKLDNLGRLTMWEDTYFPVELRSDNSVYIGLTYISKIDEKYYQRRVTELSEK